MSTENTEKTTPKFTGAVPAFQIGNYQQAVEHYVNWLGFNLDWEWREAPGKPVIMHVSRDEVPLFLNEYDEGRRPSHLNVIVTNLKAYADEVNARRTDSVQIEAGNPCPTPQEVVTAVGGPIGLAIETLFEFPEYGSVAP